MNICDFCVSFSMSNVVKSLVLKCFRGCYFHTICKQWKLTFSFKHLILSNFDTVVMNPSARTARLAREVKNFETKPPWGISCRPEKEDTYDVLLVTLLGPKGSPFENGSFKLVVTIPPRYPFEPPLVKFTTPVYHPNIDKGGRICMDMLKMPPKGAWLPTITLETLLVSLQTLLANPNPDDPLMMDIANEYKYNIDQYLENAKRHTAKYAM